MRSTLGGCERNNVCNPMIGKHENLVKLPVTVSVDIIEAIFLANHTKLVILSDKNVNRYLFLANNAVE